MNYKKNRDENTKPYIYCPKHKLRGENIYLEEKYIYPCNIKGCYCNNVKGWIVTCPRTGHLIHSCINGCNIGIACKHSKSGMPDFVDFNIALMNHHRHYHRGSPVYLYF
jgi:hypothetical protein